MHILHPIGKPLKEQIPEGFSVVGKYFFGRKISDKIRSGMGRHNVMASYAFVVMSFGIVMLAAGGVGMILSHPDTGLYEVYLGLHIAGAGFLALFVFAHLFAVVNRSNWPLLAAVFSTGKVKKSWVERHMPAYFPDEDSRNESDTGETIVIFNRTG